MGYRLSFMSKNQLSLLCITLMEFMTWIAYICLYSGVWLLIIYALQSLSPSCLPENPGGLFIYVNHLWDEKYCVYICRVEYQLPNLIVGAITKESLYNAFENGITADQASFDF